MGIDNAAKLKPEEGLTDAAGANTATAINADDHATAPKGTNAPASTHAASAPAIPTTPTARQATLEFASSAIAQGGLSRGDGHIGLRRVLTYGTFDLLHYGHVRLLQRAAALGDYLVVALSTDEFNASKGKTSFYPYEVRREMLEALRYVDLVIPEYSWEQKANDVRRYAIDVVCMGADWEGSEHFEYLRSQCDLVFLSRTEGISTTQVKNRLSYEPKAQ